MIRPETMIWTSKYLNNIIEQDHRRVKQRVYPMLGFKRFRHATVVIRGIELVHKIRKGQYDTSAVKMRAGSRAPQVWDAVLFGRDRTGGGTRALCLCYLHQNLQKIVRAAVASSPLG